MQACNLVVYIKELCINKNQRFRSTWLFFFLLKKKYKVDYKIQKLVRTGTLSSIYIECYHLFAS